METATLDDFMAWNDQLAAAVEAGVPVDLGLTSGTGDVAAALEKINAVVARRTSQGATLAAAIEAEEQVLPSAYRSLMKLSLSSGTPTTGLALSNRVGRNIDRTWDAGRLALLYPVLVCCVAFLGLAGFCLYFVPVLDETYASLGVKKGTGLRLIESVRQAMPYWAIIFPVGLIAAGIWVRRKSRPLQQRRRELVLDWIPGVSRAMFYERAAIFAETMAGLLETGITFGDALRAAAGVWNDRSLYDLTVAFAFATEKRQASESGGEFGRRLPPFLRWALLDSEQTTGRVCALRTAANVCRRAALRRQNRLRIVLPLLVAILIGGTATLLYGLALFVPVIELLRGLAVQYSS
jgi:type II secretory pathway component PulF